MIAKSRQFAMTSKADMAAQLKAESADYAAAQRPERSQGVMHSGVNRLVRGSQNITPEPITKGTGFISTGNKDPYRIR
jgi:hypothetical protein